MCFPSLGVSVGSTFVFSCPQELEHVIGRVLSKQEVEAATAGVDLFNNSSNKWYAAVLTYELYKLLWVLSDKDVSKR